MKEKLIERLSLMDQAIAKQTQVLHQANADLNMLNGCKQELAHIISMAEQEEKEFQIVMDEEGKVKACCEGEVIA